MAVLEAETQPQSDGFVDSAQQVRVEGAPERPTPLAARAIDFLQIAAKVAPGESGTAVEERSIWQPDSWLMQRGWQELAEAGAGEEALTVAALQEVRNPLATVQALYRLALRANSDPGLSSLVSKELRALHAKLFGDRAVTDAARQVERLLFAAASAARIQDDSLALACLERLDQIERGWDLVILRAESRTLLAETISAVGMHPLTSYLVSTSIRRHEEAGAQFLHQILSGLHPRADNSELSRRAARLLQRCVETFQYATLASLNSRRLAAVAFGQAGMIPDVLSQVTTMANVQEARREAGISSISGDPHFLRQVTRPNAKPDVDFQLYALQQAIAAMPLRQLSREERVQLASRVAELAVQSDGWTAAGATATLVGLGALKYAVDVVDFISAGDPTRSEGVISLVRALLSVGNEEQAKEQVDKALSWLKTYPGRNPERATIWGVAEVFLDYGRPGMALYLLEQRHDEPVTFADRIRRMMRSGWTDDTLRDNRVRLRALVERDGIWTAELQELFDQLRRWAPVLLDGEALISYYLDGMLAPLLRAGHTEQAVALLPSLADALASSTGDKHSVHVQKAARLLTGLLAAESDPTESPESAPASPHDESASVSGPPAHVIEALHDFLVTLWAGNAHRGLWQTVHGIEGSFPLLYALEGPGALVAIAGNAADDGGLWQE